MVVATTGNIFLYGMATQRIDLMKLFNLIKDHKKVLVLASRESDKGDFITQFFSLDDEDRIDFMQKTSTHTRKAMQERDTELHRMGCTSLYFRKPRARLNEQYDTLLRGRILFNREEFPVKQHLASDVSQNTRIIAFSTVEEGKRETAFFMENGFHVMHAPLL